jgi:4-hydroxy-3-polyprenylbenzoate decarboxylase
MEDKSLRGFLAHAERLGELRRIKTEVLPDEIFGLQWKLFNTGGPAVVFENVKGSDMPIVVNVLGTRDRLAMACNFPRGKRHVEYRNMYVEKIENKDAWLKPKLVATGPCKEVILQRNEATFRRLPIFRWHPSDAGAYITLPASIIKDDKFGTNVGTYRMMIHDDKTSGIMCNIFQHQGIYLNRAIRSGKAALPCAIALGAHPSIYISSVTSLDLLDDELQLSGALQGQPVEVVKAETWDLEVPANAEIILEGEISTTARKEEAPFAEYEGYHEEPMLLPVFTLKCITMRKDAMYQMTTADKEGEVLRDISVQSKVFLDLKKNVTGFVDCWSPPSGHGYTIVVAIKKYFPGWGQQAIHQIMGIPFVNALVNCIIVVDDGIDPSDTEQWIWALSTRVDPYYDVVITKPTQVYPLNPAARECASTNARTNADFLLCSKMGIDATLKGPEERPTRNVIPVRLPKEILARVEERWAELGLGDL